MTALFQDLRYTFRNLARSPGFAVVAVLTLALGIGANSAILSVVYGVLLKPLPYPEPERLMLVTSAFPTLGFDQFWVSPPEYLEFQEQSRSFEEVGAYVGGAVNLSGSDALVRAPAGYVTAELFDVLGVGAARGRLFTKEEDAPGTEPVAVLTHELWQRAFGGDPALVGGTLEVDGVTTQVLGVLPAGFDVHDQGYEVYLPLGLDPANPGSRSSHYLYLVGRLADGISPEEARSEIVTLVARWEADAGEQHTLRAENHYLRLDPLHDDMVGGVRSALVLLLAAVGFVLLIACVNVANLLLVRAEARRKEIAVRASIGAGRGRLLRQFLTEGLVLGLLGGVAGLGLAAAGLRLLVAANLESLPRSGEVGLDLMVVGFTFLLAVGTGVVFGLAPAFHLTTSNMNATLKEGGDRTTLSAARHRLRQGLVGLEVALAVVLVIGSGLMIRSFWNVVQVDAGFDPGQLVTFRVALPQAQYAENRDVTSFYSRLIDRLAALPGIESAAALRGLPPNRQVNANTMEFEGLEETEDGPAHNVDYWQFVTPRYFETLGIPLAEGRLFSHQDDDGSPPVVLVNETMAKRFWGDEGAIGRRLRPGWSGEDDEPWFEVVGVVKDVKQGGLDQETGTELYFSYPQTAAHIMGAPRTMNLALRSSLPLAVVAAAARQELAALDPSLPMANLRTMDEVFAGTVAQPRFLAQLLGIFAAVALLLAAVGTYGILSYQVAERRQEIGVRMALGAAGGDVLQLILRQGMAITGLGLAVGLGLALGLSRLARTLLFGVEPGDPATFVAVAVFLAAVAFAACLLPARQATRVDPIVALRYE